MNTNVSLFGELCSICGNESAQQEIWNVLQKYQIKALAGFDNFESCMQRFLNAKEVEGLSKCSISNYTFALKSFYQYIGNVPPANIDVDNIRAYICYLKNDKHLKKSSISQNINIVRCFFNWLYDENLIITNPMNNVKSIKLDDSCIRHPLTSDELTKIRNSYTNLRDKTLVEFMLNTGCRLSEVSNLTIDKLNFNNNSAVVTGKGNKTRVVLFNETTANLLKSYIPSNKCNYVFTCNNKTDKLSNASIQYIIRKLGERAGLSGSLYPHLFRHTFATNALNNGMNIVTIQHLLGHDDVSTTQVYAELNIDTIYQEYHSTFGG